MKEIWYKVSSKGGGWSKYYSIDEIISEKKRSPYHPVLKITKVTEEILEQDIIDNINSKVNWVNK